MRALSTLLLVLIIACSKPVDKTKFNGIWEVYRVCEDSTYKLNSFVRLSNDTLYSFEPEYIISSKTHMNLTNDSITIYDECFLERGVYEFEDGNLIIGERNIYLWKKLNQDSISSNLYFLDKEMSLDLPLTNEKSQIPRTGSRMMLIGKYIPKNYHFNCDRKNEFNDIKLQPLDFEEETIKQPFELPNKTIIRYLGVNVKTSDLADIGKYLEKNEDLIIFADKKIETDIVNRVVEELNVQNTNIYQAFEAINGKLVYKKTNANNGYK